LPVHAATQRLSAAVNAAQASTRIATAGLVADLRADPGLLERFKATFVAREREWLAVVLDRAVARGELAARPDLEFVHALLVGPVYAGLSILDTPPSPGAAGHFASVIAGGLPYAPPPPHRRPAKRRQK